MHEILGTMRLSALLHGTGARGDLAGDPDITGVTGDSRQVIPGALFCALPGAQRDGHDFAAEAVRRGAVAVVAERPVDCAPALLVLVPSARRAMALAAAALLDHPARDLALAGITGTNGKTTVSYLLEACARAAGIPTGVIGTITHRYPGVERPASHTTPESHGDPGAPRRDARRRRAGWRSWRSPPTPSPRSGPPASPSPPPASPTSPATTSTTTATWTATSPPSAGSSPSSWRPAGWRWSTPAIPGASGSPTSSAPGAPSGATAPGRATRSPWRTPALSLDGIFGVIRSPRGAVAVHSPLVGGHNVENLLCAAGLALALGVPAEAVERGLAACRGAPGRLERIEGRGITLFVDYAHTDDALGRALEALRALTPRRLLIVFGCGGDRDRGKRPLMGEAAGLRSELTVVTSDNPRSEDPLAVIADILPGLERAGRARLDEAAARAGTAGYLVEPDRRAAIDLAVACAREGDAVLLAGKGHETTQTIGAEKRHFDDREEARRALGAR